MKQTFKKLACFSMAFAMIFTTTAFANTQTEKSDVEKEIELKQSIAAEPYLQNNIMASLTRTPDEAFLAVEEEEAYIANLINTQLSDGTTDTSNWEFNLEYLIDNYEIISNLQDVKMHYVDSYIEAYKYVKLSKGMPAQSQKNNNQQSIMPAYSSAFADKVIEYAKKYYDTPNTSEYVFFPDVDSTYYDCANFASQSIKYAGKTMEGSKGQHEDFSKWFSYGNTFIAANISSTWRGADAFKWYWSSKVNYNTFSSVGTDSYAYGYKGDIISLLNSNDRATHTVIIVGYASGSDFLIAQHSDKNGGQFEVRLSGKAFSKFRIYTMS